MGDIGLESNVYILCLADQIKKDRNMNNEMFDLVQLIIEQKTKHNSPDFRGDRSANIHHKEDSLLHNVADRH